VLVCAPRLSAEDELRRELAEVCWKLYERGYVVATDGNVSVRLDDGRLLVTPSGYCKGELKPGDFVFTSLRGEPLDPSAPRPSGEIRLHVAAYEERPDIRCVLHAHPKTAVAFSLAGVELASCILPEIVIGVGNIATADYATPTTQKAADVVRGLIKTCDAIILDRHGSVTVGKSIGQAFHNLERLEWAAEVTKAARDLGGVKSLPKDEVDRLLQVREKYSGEARRLPCNLCGACVTGARMP
jgi:L-fuculose-phosphate aldolase